MSRFAALFFSVAMLLFVVPTKPLAPISVWHIDSRHSDARLAEDGATDFGKTKMDFTIGFTRITGTVRLDPSNPDDSKFDFSMYPGGTVAPAIDEEGKIRSDWVANHANTTLICFHSKGAQRAADGRWKTTGNLVLTRIDRNVELTPNEGYSGPVYGPPILHRVVKEASFFFDIPPAISSHDRDGGFMIDGHTHVVREEFPQLVKAVVATAWPPVVKDKNCDIPVGVGEGYSGAMCTGTFLEAPPLPEVPHAANGEDLPGPPGFNSVTGARLDIIVRLRLTPATTSAD